MEFAEAGRLLSYGTRESAESSPGSAAFHHIHYIAPTLGLTAADQDLLLVALDGATDEDLAAALNLRLPTVKARWRSMFLRIERAKPEWTRESNGSFRGAQRRHRILAYSRAHPEELRPYDWTVRS